MLVFGTILALCLLNNALAQDSDSGRNQDLCSRHARSWVSCSAVNSTDALLPHPDDCSLFYYCPHPALPPVCRECPAGLHFNPVSHVCDWPEQAGCQEPDTDPPQTEEPSNAPEFDELGSCSRHSESPVSCEGDPLTLIPHPEDCNAYYICVSRKLRPICLKCPGDLHFNPKSNICEPPEEAGCEERNSTSEGPGDSLEDPADSSKGPEDSSKGPGDSSGGPGDSSKGPGDTSEGPGDSSKGPRDSSEGPGYSSKGPRDSSEGPGDSSKGPGDTSEGPGDSSEGSADSSKGPENSSGSSAPSSEYPSGLIA